MFLHSILHLQYDQTNLSFSHALTPFVLATLNTRGSACTIHL